MTDSPLNLRPEELALVLRILQTYVPHCQVRAFGSRVTGTHKPHSDIDLVLRTHGPVDTSTLSTLQDALSESALPMRVDILDWENVSPAFRSIIEKTAIVLQEATHDSQ